MTSIAEPTITHPAWCAPSKCAEERDKDGRLISVYHWSMPDVWGSPPNGDHDADLTYIRVDDPLDEAGSEATTAFFRFHGSDSPVTVDQVESLGLWIATEATVMRRQIAGETGAAVSAATVLDEDLNLTVHTDDGIVFLTGDPCDDGAGEWSFTAREARELAAALLDHAARAEGAEEA